MRIAENFPATLFNDLWDSSVKMLEQPAAGPIISLVALFVGMILSISLVWFTANRFVKFLRAKQKRDTEVDGTFVVRLFDLEGDPLSQNFPYTLSLYQSLHDALCYLYPGAKIDLRRIFDTITWPKEMNGQEALLAAHKNARQKLKQWKGVDLTIWGNVNPSNDRMHLYYTALIDDENRAQELSSKSAIKADDQLGENVATVLALKLHSEVLSALKSIPASHSSVDKLRARATEAAQLASQVIENQRQAALVEASAEINQSYGAEKHDPTALRRSAEEWKRSAEFWRARDFDEWYDKRCRAAKSLENILKMDASLAAIDTVKNSLEETLSGIDGSQKRTEYTAITEDLSRIHERRSDVSNDDEPLNKALDVLTSARTLWQKNDDPEEYGHLSNRIGDVYVKLSRYGELERTARLQHALDHFQEAASTLDAGQFIWRSALSRRKAADSLSALGEVTRDHRPIFEAMHIYRDVGAILMRNTDGLEWSATQHGHATALKRLSGLTRSPRRRTANLRQSVRLYRAALEERSYDQHYVARTESIGNLGDVYRMLSESRNRNSDLKLAINNLDEAIAKLLNERTGNLLLLAYFWACRGRTRMRMGEAENDTQQFREAIADFGDASKIWVRPDYPKHWADITGEVGLAYLKIGEIERDPEADRKADLYLRQAEEVFEEHGLTEQRMKVYEARVPLIGRL